MGEREEHYQAHIIPHLTQLLHSTVPQGSPNELASSFLSGMAAQRLIQSIPAPQQLQSITRYSNYLDHGHQVPGNPLGMSQVHHTAMGQFNPTPMGLAFGPGTRLSHMGLMAPSTPLAPTPYTAAPPPTPSYLNTPIAYPDLSPPEDPNFTFVKGLFEEGRYNEFIKKVRLTRFNHIHHGVLREWWWLAVYGRRRSTLPEGRNLSPMMKYRLRQRHPFPETIWNGGKITYNMTATTKERLINFFDNNPYPCPEDRKALAREVGMTDKSLLHWFKNRRSRHRTSISPPNSSHGDSSHLQQGDPHGLALMGPNARLK